MNKLIIYVDDREVIDNETKFRVIIEIEGEEHEKKIQELYLNNESIEKLKESGKFIVETKTFADKILDEFEKSKPEFCKD